ncbi:MAG: helix-turn-helix transcriptional regulator [Alphaproteobacteria bacterium]|nr:helix-turn-helix transcriptional regulator [Alphaproteobacteria bacterium]
MKEKRPEILVIKIIQQFKTLRVSQGISHETLAKKTGVTRPAISHLENGKRKPSLLMSLRLAEALNTDLPDIIRSAEGTEQAD